MFAAELTLDRSKHAGPVAHLHATSEAGGRAVITINLDLYLSAAGAIFMQTVIHSVDEATIAARRHIATPSRRAPLTGFHLIVCSAHYQSQGPDGSVSRAPCLLRGISSAKKSASA